MALAETSGFSSTWSLILQPSSWTCSCGKWPGFPESEKGCEVYQALGSKLAHNYFCYFIGQCSYKASPDLRGRKIDFISWWEGLQSHTANDTNIGRNRKLWPFLHTVSLSSEVPTFLLTWVSKVYIHCLNSGCFNKKHHRLGSLNNKNLLLPVLESCKSKTKALAGLMRGEDLLSGS